MHRLSAGWSSRTGVDNSRLERIAEAVATAPNIEVLAKIAFDREA